MKKHRNLSTSTSLSIAEMAKKAAASQAVADHLRPEHRWVGIGSGSTVVYVVQEIAKWDKTITDKMSFVSTGDQSRLLIEESGLRLGALSQMPKNTNLDVSFDGADEVDPDLNLIKGGGACLLQEKVVAVASQKFICVADYRKTSEGLCTKWTQGIPVEVLPCAATRVLDELKRLGSIDPSIRQGGSQKAGPVVTDNSMWIIDAPFAPLQPHSKRSSASPSSTGAWSAETLAERLIAIPGVMETGLFTGMVTKDSTKGSQKPVAVYLGLEDGGIKVLS
ncbi:unnamed protein product [Clonostachys rosea]|uniref:Ribose-5-phosphate isomerase n=1 Tax=Bionectria ochroleuca TaxID=29856 RepID=A0ABY6U8J5_BIOOC|nr:unnamed protein product [Clonostachys rosea]